MIRSFVPGRRARVPTIIQQEAVECGAACLAMVCASHGRWVALEEMRELCGVGRDGTKATNLLRAARSFGLIAKGLKREVADLGRLPTPFIAFWNFNHFVVVERVVERRGRPRSVWLNDPATGPRMVGADEFELAFTGIVLAFEPGDEFREAGSRASLPQLLWERVAGYGFGFTHAVLAGLLMLMPAILAAGFTHLFVDRIILDDASTWLKPLVAALMVFALFKALLTYLQQSALARTQTALTTAMAAQQMWVVLHLSLTFFAQRFAGDVANRFAMVDRMGGIVAGGLAPAAISLVSIVGYGLALLVLDPWLAAIFGVAAPLALLALAVSAGRLENANRRMIVGEAKLQSATIQGIAMAEDFKATGTEGFFLARWQGHHARVVEAEQRARSASNVLNDFAGFLMLATTTIVIVAGGMRVMDGAITIGILLAFQTLMGAVTAPVLSLVGIGGQMQQVRGIAERLDDIARYRSIFRAAPEPATTRPPALAGSGLALEDVTFGYVPLAPPFIGGLSFSVAPGTRVALVGGSGSGKSTIGRLAVGLLQPQEGEVRLGGLPLDAWPVAHLRKSVAYVDQEIGLFEGTIRDNITLWDPSLSDERVIAAAQDAAIHSAITSRPKGYGARVYENGGNLSGGERQRLALARAFAVDPAILVLDEATSALDPPVENAVMKAIRRRGCACIIVAHRLSTIRDCDRILVLEAGRIVEEGTHDTLVARGGAYARLVEH